MPSESDRLLAAGAPITCASGEVRLRFTLRALKRCEDTYGTLNGAVAELHWLLGADGDEAYMGRFLALLATVTGDDDIDVLSTPGRCLDALLDAWLEAFPAPEGKAVGETTDPPSPGVPGGGSPSLTPT